MYYCLLNAYFSFVYVVIHLWYCALFVFFFHLPTGLEMEISRVALISCIYAYMLNNTICPNLKTVQSLNKIWKKQWYEHVCVLRTCQVGHTVGVDFKLVTFQMLADESQQSVQDSHCPRYRGGWRVPVAWRHSTQGNRKLIKMPLASFTLPTLHNLYVSMHN